MASFTPGPSGGVTLPQPTGGEPPPYGAAIEAGAISVERFVPGRSDDDAALADAKAFANGRPMMLAGRTYKISQPLSGARLIGQGAGSTIIQALADSGITIGNPLGQIPLSNPGIGWFTYDGNNVDTKGVVTNVIAGHFPGLIIANVNGDALKILGQNSKFYNPIVASTGTGFGLVFDNGAGGNAVYGANMQGGNQLDFRQTVNSAGYGYVIPQDNHLYDLVGDNPVASTYGIRHRAGGFNVLHNCNIFHRNALRIICFEANTGGYNGAGYVNGRLYLMGRTEIIGQPGAGQAAIGADFVTGGNAGGMGADIGICLAGELITSGIDMADLRWGSSTPIQPMGVHLSKYGPTRPFFLPEGVGAYAGPSELGEVLPNYYVLIKDSKAAGTDGGTFTTGAWQTRVLNTKSNDVGNLVALAGNQMTVQPGTYRVKITCPAFAVNAHKSRLRNITDGQTILSSMPAFSAATTFTSNNSIITGTFRLTAAKVLEVQHQGAATQAANGFGTNAGFGETEEYTTVEMWQVAPA